MPTIPLHPPAKDRTSAQALPGLLQTPSGLAILEIQGTLHSSLTSVGKLVFPLYDPANDNEKDTAWQKRVYLYVGQHQRLTGEVKKLGKPLAVVRRRGEGEELEVVEVVRWKLLFAHRPEPVGQKGGGE